jgi:uncharacterized protein (TIGR00255 family)
MLKSMTAYGRGVTEFTIGRVTCEIQSVNRKFMEINVSLPRELMRFDVEVKKWINAAVGRGAISVKFNVVFNQTIPLDISPNIPLALKIQKAAQELSKALSLPSSRELTLKMLSDEENLLVYDDHMENEDLYRTALKDAFDQALKVFLEMKSHEGEAVYVDICNRVEILQKEIREIAKHAPTATKKYHEKLTERLKEYTTSLPDDQERILKEVAIFAERIDISEEITLFESHLKRFSSLISHKGGSVAKTLEFMLQELNRETNTIGSKSSELEVSHRVIEMKSELEKIREIIQNVE